MLNRFAVLSLLFLFATFNTATHAADLTWTSKSVVKLFTTKQSWSVSQPWSKKRSKQLTCSAFFIEQGILTNAHCVADATYIEMEVPNLADKLEVQTIAINHQLDLALLRPVKAPPELISSPISFGNLPTLREKVVTIGYPLGGRQVSYTEGVVSRIDIMQYSHSNIAAPLVQTDASINLGNSGGPVFSDKTGHCIGVATQKLSSAEGMGFFIPTPIIQQFLLDLKNHTIDGIPSLGALFQTLENPAARDQLKLTKQQSGIRVRSIAKNSTFDGVLEADDVVLSIEGHDVMNDGRVPFQDSGRIWLGYHVTTKQVGDIIQLSYSRDGVVKTIETPLKAHRLGIVPQQPFYDQKTPYYMLGGLLFIAVEQRYLWNWGRNWRSALPTSLKSNLGKIYGENNLEQLVVISEVFDASVNKGYTGEIENRRVTQVNGTNIYKLTDLELAIKKNTEKFHLIELEGNIKIILNRQDAEAEDANIRKRYGIKN